ncbi:hypothetical protein ES707_11037 [subsurface metagenome]
MEINKVARLARIGAYKNKVKQKLASRIIDTSKPEFADLIANKDPQKLMSSLNGEIILERDLNTDGSLRGVVSVSVDDLASMLPDLKKDTEDKGGWKKHLDKFKAEGLEDILKDVADPTPDEFELSATEELATLDINSMSDAEAKQKLRLLQAKGG